MIEFLVLVVLGGTILLAFTAVIAALKVLLWLVLLPFRLLLGLLLLPLLLLKGLIGGLVLLVVGPVLAIALLVAGLVMAVAFLVPLLPFLFVGFLVWLLVRAGDRTALATRG